MKLYNIGDFKLKWRTSVLSAWFRHAARRSYEKDAATEGYPFYTGKIKISKEINADVNDIQRCLLHFDDIGATAATVRINGCKAGDIIWRLMKLTSHGISIPEETVLKLK